MNNITEFKIQNMTDVFCVKYDFLDGYCLGNINGYEIDFVCKKNNQKIYIQVTYLLENDETIERELRPLLMIKDNYPKYVISMDQFDRSRDGIKNVNLLDFLTDYDLVN